MPRSSYGYAGTAAAGFLSSLGHAGGALNPFDNDEDVIAGQDMKELSDRCAWAAVLITSRRPGASRRKHRSTNSCSRDDISGRLSTYRMGVSGKFTSHPIGILSTIAIQLFAVRKDWAVNPSQAQYVAQARSVEADALTHAHGMT